MSAYRQPGRRIGTPMADAPSAPWWALRRRLRWAFRSPCRAINPGRVDRFDEISEQLYQLRQGNRSVLRDVLKRAPVLPMKKPEERVA